MAPQPMLARHSSAPLLLIDARGSVTAWAPAADAPHEADPFLVLDQPFASTPAIRVDGPVDATTAPALDRALGTATAAGTRSLSVDLTGVSHLASAGVAVLHHHCATAAANHTDLRLHSQPAAQRP